MAPSFVVIYGAPTGSGRLASAAEVARARAETTTGDTQRVAFIDLSLVTGGGPLGDHVATMISVVNEADAAIIVSPVYRASMPGLLKCLLDELPVEALKFKPVGVIAMGGSPHHYLAVDRHLRDVLAWFGALVAPTSVYATGKSFDDEKKPLASLVDEISLLVDGVAALAQHPIVGPEPLAASAW
jgi:FMN reductase